MRGLLFCLLTFVAAAGGCAAGESTERVPPRAAASGTLVVFADESDLWLWSATDDRTRRLTRNGPEPIESRPRFRSRRAVSYIADGSLYTLDLITATRRLVVPVRTVIAFAWSPDRDTLAYVLQAGGVGPHALYLFRPGEKRARLVRRFSRPGGAVWSAFDLRRGTRSGLQIALGRMHPALSPDRRLLALDSGRAWRPNTTRRGCACTLSVLDLVTGRERSLGTGFVAPLWVAPRSLASTEARACSGAECGMDVPMWVARKRSARLGVTTGDQTQIALRSTLDADVLLAP